MEGADEGQDGGRCGNIIHNKMSLTSSLDLLKHPFQESLELPALHKSTNITEFNNQEFTGDFSHLCPGRLRCLGGHLGIVTYDKNSASLREFLFRGLWANLYRRLVN